MKQILRNSIKAIMDTYISFECACIRLFTSPQKEKILILRKDVIGDFILFIPTLKHYREYYTGKELHLVVNTVALELKSQFSFIDNIIPYDGKKFRTNFWYRRSFFHKLAKEGYTTVIHAVYSREYISDRMVRATGAKDTITFKAEYGNMYTDSQYTRIIDTPKELTEPERNMYFVSRVIGKEVHVTYPNLDIELFDDKEFKTLKEKLSLVDKKYVVLLPGAGARYRTWQLEKFAEVAMYITSLGYTVLVSGSKGDVALCEELLSHIVDTRNVHMIAGVLDIPNFAHLLQNSLFYFGSETGPLHLTTALQVPAIAILGAGHRGRFYPYGDPNICRFVADDTATCIGDGWKCSGHLKQGEIAPCIRNISVAQAKGEIDTLLAILR
jgi:ADP-heptose:LPS heptosyltransferase